MNGSPSLRLVMGTSGVRTDPAQPECVGPLGYYTGSKELVNMS
jgi:hypothetical protein